MFKCKQCNDSGELTTTVLCPFCNGSSEGMTDGSGCIHCKTGEVECITPCKNPVHLTDVQVDGVDLKDYPDFCDAYITDACWADGTELTDDELDTVTEDSSLVYEYVIESLE